MKLNLGFIAWSVQNCKFDISTCKPATVFIIEKPDKNLSGDIILPASKSISNRLLIIRALSPRPFRINNLSDSDDTKVLKNAIKSDRNVIDIRHAGTSMRFLTGYYAINPGERILTGSERMKKRPVGDLVDALKTMGADIQYLEKEGFPPLKIKGRQLEGGEISIKSSVSSQFISTLLMIAPVLKKGLKLTLIGEAVSPSYIKLTLGLMELFGIKHVWKGQEITIRNQDYKPADIKVEADWSSASYWYEMAALSEHPDVVIRGLSQSSLQGDSVQVRLFERFGICTEFVDDGIRITNKATHKAELKITNSPRFDYSFINQPDLVQTFAVLCALKGIPFRFDGTQTLRVKETDRIQALKNELSKFGIRLESTADGSWIEFGGPSESAGGISQRQSNQQVIFKGRERLQGKQVPGSDGKIPGARGTIKIKTYQDHRMAMAFAPTALLGYKIDIENPDVVSKSYPGFWEDLKKVGFRINQRV